jgi:hypothetical protein
MKYLKYILLLLFILAIAYSFTAARWTQVIVKPYDEYKQTAYYIMDEDGDKISLITYQSNINKGILSLGSGSNLPIEKQTTLLSKILGRVLKDEDRAELRTLFVGRLEYTFGPNNKQMSDRLKKAAANSPLWDGKKAWQDSGYANKTVKVIANEAMIYPELKKVFEEHKMEIKFSSAEKVLINGEGLPFDCLAWFSIAPENTHP